MVSGGGSLHISLCGASVTGAASLVAKCETFCSKMLKITLKKTFLWHFSKSVTGSESMCRSIMASSSQKLS